MGIQHTFICYVLKFCRFRRAKQKTETFADKKLIRKITLHLFLQNSFNEKILKILFDAKMGLLDNESIWRIQNYCCTCLYFAIVLQNAILSVASLVYCLINLQRFISFSLVKKGFNFVVNF